MWLPDDRVKAVTPFVFKYEGHPFINFSWVNPDNSPFPQYETVKNFEKVEGNPEIKDQGWMEVDLPQEMVVQSTYRLYINLKNEGQGVWNVKNGYTMTVPSDPILSIQSGYVYDIEPKETGIVELLVKTGTKPGKGKAVVQLINRDKKVVVSKDWSFETVPFPKLAFRTSFYPKLKVTADDIELQVFDERESLVYKKSHLSVVQGTGSINAVPNVVLEKKYRIVVLRPYYLPRQTYVTFNKDDNIANFPIMLPLDFNSDGTFNMGDIMRVVTDLKVLRILLP